MKRIPTIATLHSTTKVRTRWGSGVTCTGRISSCDLVDRGLRALKGLRFRVVLSGCRAFKGLGFGVVL